MYPLANALKVHVALNVRDLEASVSFYRRLVAIEPVKHKSDYAKFDVTHPGLNLTLNQGTPAAGTISHLGIQVSSTEDVLSIRNQWRESGLDTRDEMQTDCCYSLQDKAWVRDPDGNEWEVFVVLQDTAESTMSCCSGAPTLVKITQ